MDYRNEITQAEAAQFLLLAPETLGRWQRNGSYDLSAFKFRRQYFYTWDEIYRFISYDEEDYRNLVREADRSPLLDRKRAARYLGISTTTLRELERSSLIRPRRAGHVVRFRTRDLDEYKQWRRRERESYYEQRMNPYMFI